MFTVSRPKSISVSIPISVHVYVSDYVYNCFYRCAYFKTPNIPPNRPTAFWVTSISLSINWDKLKFCIKTNGTTSFPGIFLEFLQAAVPT